MTVHISSLGAGKVEVYQVGAQGVYRAGDAIEPPTPPAKVNAPASQPAVAPVTVTSLAPKPVEVYQIGPQGVYRPSEAAIVPPTPRAEDYGPTRADYERQVRMLTRPGFFEKHKTLLIAGGVVLAGGAAAWLLLKPTRGFRRPAVAGLGDAAVPAGEHRKRFATRVKFAQRALQEGYPLNAEHHLLYAIDEAKELQWHKEHGSLSGLSRRRRVRRRRRR